MMMGTLAGNMPAWGEDWGYKRGDSCCSGDATEMSPARRRDENTVEDAQAPSHNFSALLFCIAFWILIALATFPGWMGK